MERLSGVWSLEPAGAWRMDPESEMANGDVFCSHFFYFFTQIGKLFQGIIKNVIEKSDTAEPFSIYATVGIR